MTNLSCLNTIITDNLAVHIDLTNINSWDLNTGLTSISLTKWKNAISDNIFLYDFGLTGYDNGRVDKMYDNLTILPTDKKLTLYRIGYNNATGGTFYDTYGMTGITATTTGTSTGNYFQLDGGYLQGFFKLKNYNYELLPPRYGSGITIETIINITPNSFNDGYFYFMGARAEDKYVPAFSGECVQFNISTTACTSSYGSPRVVSKTVFSGVTTSENHFLNNFVDQEILTDGSSTPNLFVTAPVENLDKGIKGNTIGFFISTDKRIGYTRINPSGLTESDMSTNYLTTGWTIIDIVFSPYEVITDRKTLDCATSRIGDFIVYVNGRRFWKIEDFDEYYFKGFKTHREKQLGVPYNISWGGGSFGLKHSYHYDIKKHIIFDNNTDLQISTGFTFTTDPFWNDPYCAVPPLDPNITGTTITGDSTTFFITDPCGTGTTANTVIKIHNTSNIIPIIIGTGMTTGYSSTTLHQYNIQYNEDLLLLSNRDYLFSVNVYDTGIFQPYHEGSIGMFFSGETDINIVEQHPYNILSGTTFNWNTITYRIRTKENTALTKVKVGLYILSDVPLVSGFTVYFDDFSYRGSDILNKDTTKDNQLVQQLYDKSFIGGIQKLRIYDTAFNSQEVLHNALIEAKNLAYGFLISKGGRLIYR